MPRWTPESRQRQADLIRLSQPWTKSTGPRTDRGKVVSSRNAVRHGVFSQKYRTACRQIRLYCALIDGLSRRIRRFEKAVIRVENRLKSRKNPAFINHCHVIPNSDINPHHDPRPHPSPPMAAYCAA
jgi:hypothetical protein